MKFLSWFFGKDKEEVKPSSFTIRLREAVPTDQSFDAWTSGNLETMLGAVNTPTNPIDRHFLLQGIVSESYKNRKEAKCREICIKYAEMHLLEFPKIAPKLAEEMGGNLPRISTFQHYSTLLTELGEYEKAISVCNDAISYKLHDGTKSGYEGRIDRITKKAAKNAQQINQ